MKEWGGQYNNEDIFYTAHFTHNHSPRAMYSAIVLQNIFQLAMQNTSFNDFSSVFEGSGWGYVKNRMKNLFSSMPYNKVNLDGVYNEKMQGLLQLLKNKKGINLTIKTDTNGYVTYVNNIPIIDNERTKDKDVGFDVGELKKIFKSYDHDFYPLLSSNFARTSEPWMHDTYNYGFRQYVSNITPQQRKQRFEGDPKPTNLSSKVDHYKTRISYPTNQLEHGAHRDSENQQLISGSLDNLSWMKYLYLQDVQRISYNYLTPNEIDAYSYLGGVASYQDMFVKALKKDFIHMITPQTYQSNYYFQIIKSVREGDIVGFGQELPASYGGVSMGIKNPNPKKSY